METQKEFKGASIHQSDEMWKKKVENVETKPVASVGRYVKTREPSVK